MLKLGRRFRTFNLPKPLKIRNLIFIIVLVVIILGVFNWLRAFIVESAYFKVDKVELVLIGRVPLMSDTVKRLLSIHKGRGIFEVDLGATRDYVLSNYPEVRTLVINKVLPNKLVLHIRPRRPIAQLSLPSGFCLVDPEGVVLPGLRSLASEGLPIISGIDSRSILASTGKKYEYAGFKKALRLLEVINQTRFSQEHEVHMIDVSDEKNLSLYIEGGIEIKIGSEDFKNRLAMLEKTFETGRLDKSQIKYIDLRFGNVIIGPRQ